MSRTLEYFFDYVSPYSYLADSQIPGLVARTGAELVCRPMLLGGLMSETGNSPPATVPAKGRYMTADLARWVDRYELPFAFNPHFPAKTITALRVSLVALEEDPASFPALKRALFRAVWVDKVDPGDTSVLKSVIDAAGLDADHLLARCGEPEIKDRLKANTEEAAARGAFGAPTFFVGDQMFFGNDRLDFVEAALR